MKKRAALRNMTGLLWTIFISLTSMGVGVAQNATVSITSVAWSPDGSKIAVGYGTDSCEPEHPEYYHIQIFNADISEILQTLTGSLCSVTALDWSPDGSNLVTTSGIDGTAIIWDVDLAQPITSFQSRAMPGFIDNVWNPSLNNNYIASISETDPNVSIWNPANGSVIFSFNANSPTAITWSPNGVSLATGNNDGVINIWNSSTGQSVTTMSDYKDAITAIGWSPDGGQIATAGTDNTIKLWDTITGQNLLNLQGHSALIKEVNWSPDSTRLATASNDGTVRIWDASTGEQLEIFQYPGRVYTVDWNPDGDYIVFGGSQSDGQDANIIIEFVGLAEGFSFDASED